MLTAVFFIAILNMGLGVAIAMFADHATIVAWLASIRPFRETAEEDWDDESSSKEGAEEIVDPSALPDGWRAMLEDQNLPHENVVEAILWLAYLETPSMRNETLEVDRAWRHPTEPAFLDGQVTRATKAWRQRLLAYARILEHHKDDPDLGDVATEFNELLQDQDYVCESTEVLADFANDVEGHRPDISEQLAKLLSTFDKVRQFVAIQLSERIRERKQYDLITEPRARDVESLAYQRIGLELILDEWERSDLNVAGNLSCVLVDVDKTSKMNVLHGVSATNRILAAFGDLLCESVRKERGFDRVIRYTGQSFMLFLGETDATSAANGAERIRQTIEVSPFLLSSVSAELTASLGVVERGKKESVPQFLARLEKCMREAKNGGRNCTYLDQGSGPNQITLPQYQVERREIQADDLESAPQELSS